MTEHMLLSEQCEAKGEAKGLTQSRQLLQQLLRVRFPTLPEELLARVKEGSLDDVARWGARVDDATTPEAVFAPPE